MDKLITDKKNMYQVKAALDRICYELSSPIQKQCLKMIDEYTDEIIQMFVNEVAKVFLNVQGVSYQTFILHFALEDRNMQVRFGLKVFCEFWVVEFLLMTL